MQAVLLQGGRFGAGKHLAGIGDAERIERARACGCMQSISSAVNIAGR